MIQYSGIDPGAGNANPLDAALDAEGAIYELEELVKNALAMQADGRRVDRRALREWQRTLARYYMQQSAGEQVKLNRRRLALVVRRDFPAEKPVIVGHHQIRLCDGVVRDLRSARKLPPSHYPQYITSFLGDGR